MLTYWKAKVVEVNGNQIKAESPVAKWDTLISPMLDGILKLPVPQVDDSVFIFAADEFNQVLRYIQTDYVNSNISSESTDVSIENTQGNVHIDGTEILLGASASDYVALAASVKAQLDSIQTAITTLVTNFNAHTHTGNLGSPTTPPLVPSTASYTAAEVAAAKVKAE